MSISKLEELTQTFQKGFPEKSSELSDLNRTLSAAKSPEETFELIREKCHFLKGAFGMYGFHGMYECCERIESTISSEPSPQSREQVSNHLQELIIQLNQHAL